jgi:hypothetical protein
MEPSAGHARADDHQCDPMNQETPQAQEGGGIPMSPLFHVSNWRKAAE